MENTTIQFDSLQNTARYCKIALHREMTDSDENYILKHCLSVTNKDWN